MTRKRVGKVTGKAREPEPPFEEDSAEAAAPDREPNCGPGALGLEPGEIEWLPPSPSVGDIVLYTRGRDEWPAMIVRLYDGERADLVVSHAPKPTHNGSTCQTFAGRVPRTPADRLHGDAAGWDLRVFPEPLVLPASALERDAEPEQ